MNKKELKMHLIILTGNEMRIYSYCSKEAFKKFNIMASNRWEAPENQTYKNKMQYSTEKLA